MSAQGKVWDGQREWTYVDLAENEQHLRYLIADHSPDTHSGKTYCPQCDRRAPCDITTLAATALAAQGREARLVAVIQSALDDLERRDEVGAVDRLRTALEGA